MMSQQQRRILGWVFAAAAAAACGKSVTEADSPADIAAPVAEVAAAITGQSAPLATAHEQGKHLGFDTNVYPGDKTMRAWKNAPGAPYSWVGYYLTAPCHKDDSWMGKRQTLLDMGWGLAVVYVGQQTWGKKPRSLSPAALARLAKTTSCSADFLSAARGVADGKDAVAKTAAEGFPTGSVIYLDIERTETIPQALRDYYTAWVKTVLADGRYVPGIYAHTHNAETIYGDVKNVFTAARRDDEPRFWIASTRDFDPSKPPTQTGHAFTGVVQGVIDAVKSVADIRLPIDINVSAWPSPSAPDSGRAVGD